MPARSLHPHQALASGRLCQPLRPARRRAGRLRAAALALALLAGALGPAAAETEQQRSVREAVSSGRYKPLADILQIAEQHVPGRVLEVELETSRMHGPVYEVEVLDQHNRKREITIQAETGQLVELDDTPMAQPGLLPLPQVLRQLARQHPGQVIEAELQAPQQGQAVYAIKLLQPDGHLQELAIAAHSGAMLRGAPELDGTAERMLPLADILERLLAQYPGTVIEAELERERSNSGDTWYYEIDIQLQHGGSVELHVEPHSAAILRHKRKD